MSHQFKPGDLALIIRSTDEINLGKVVRLVEELAVGQSCMVGDLGFSPRQYPSWVCETPDGSACLAVWQLPSGESLFRSAGVNRTAWMIPLRGDLTPELQKAKVMPV